MARTLQSTPVQDGFFMPAEFSEHERCWLFWPERTDNWRAQAAPAQRAFAAVAAAIARFEPVTVAVGSKQFATARNMLAPEIRVLELPYNDAWARDIAPTFLVDGKGGVRGVDWQFNAWGGLQGGLYCPWDLDDAAAQRILEIEKIDRYRADFVLEGGAVHVDGEGTLLATEECVLNKNRNPHLSKSEMEANLRTYLGVEKIIWLKRGLAGDETDGHIDNICCFAKPGVVLLNWTEDKKDPQYEICCEALQILSQERDARGRALRVEKVPQPAALHITAEESAGIEKSANSGMARQSGDRLTATYINFYIANGAIIAPLFDDYHDESAHRQLSALFPDRQVIGVPAREIVLGGGGIHCITQQQPKQHQAR